MGTVGLVFAPLAPLVAVGAAVVMWINSWVYKYQLMFCYVSKVETGGVSPAFGHPFFFLSNPLLSAYGTQSSIVFWFP